MKKQIDMPSREFRKYGHQLVDWISDYLQTIEKQNVTPSVKPGDIKASLSISPPERGENMKKILEDMEHFILPGVTHWNHPNFMGYFNSTSSGPGILAEFLAAGLNQNAMIWKTSPASTELEEVVLGWFREMVGLPSEFWGIIYDTASTSCLHAFAAAREKAYEKLFSEKKFFSRKEILPLMFYTSEQANISVEKAALTIGIEPAGIKKIKTDALFRMDAAELKRTIEEDKKQGCIPFCVCATIGTTSTVSIDPIKEIAAICKEYDLWLHIDAAYAGNAAILPEKRKLFAGWEEADSIVINPHKWMFVPVDLSVFYTRRPEILKKAFTYVPEYLKTGIEGVENQMDYSFQLGRRFRSLKLWFVIRYFGVNGLREIIREQVRLAKYLEVELMKSKRVEIIAPVNFATVCFRVMPRGIRELSIINEINGVVLNSINNRRKYLISHSTVKGKYFIRVVLSGLRTSEKHVNGILKEIISIKKKVE